MLAILKDSDILLVKTDDFFRFVKKLGVVAVWITPVTVNGNVKCSFYYKGIKISTFATTQQVRAFDKRLVIP